MEENGGEITVFDLDIHMENISAMSVIVNSGWEISAIAIK